VSVSFGGSWISYHARATPDKTALADLPSGRRLSYAELDERAGHAAGALRDSFGVGRGDRVAMLSRNCALAFELMYACARLGAIFVPLNIRLSDAELARLASDAEPAVVIGERELLDRPVRPGVPALSWDDGYEQAVAGAAVAEPVPLEAADPWVIIYTSGTTGLPKGAVVSHAGSQATMLAELTSGQVTSAATCLTALPAWHVAGLNLFTNPVLFAVGTVLVMQSYDPAAALDLITREDDPVTHFTGAPAHYQFMQALPQFADARLRDFCAGVGGAPVPAAMVNAWAERGVTLRTIYGITEAGAAVTMSPPGTAVTMPGDVGLPLWHLRCRVMDGDRSCDVGEPDRTKDMYISGGENVYPAEVEEALYHHPAVAEVAVVGVPDERWGETGAAWIVPAPGAQADPGQIRAWLREHIAAYKVPRDIHLVGELPRNATGKVLKAELRRQAAADGPGAR
jgi:fatty-acyl-CoA synthase